MSIFTKFISWFFADPAVQQADVAPVVMYECSHNWDKWGEPHDLEGGGFTLFQTRHCLSCNMMVTRKYWRTGQ